MSNKTCLENNSHTRRNPPFVAYILILKIGNIFHESSTFDYTVTLWALPHLIHDQGEEGNQGSKRRKEKEKNREMKTSKFNL